MRRVVTILTLIIASGCASTEQPTERKRVAVVANYTGDATVLAIDDTTGALTPVPGSPFTSGQAPSSVAIHPSGAFAYVVNSRRAAGGGDVWAYRIDRATGALTPAPGSPFAVAGNPWSVAIHPSGTFAYVTSDEDLWIFTIDANTGALAPTAGSPFATGHSRWVTIHPSGRFAYVLNDDNLQGSLSVFSVNSATGALTPVAHMPFIDGDRPACPVRIHPSGAFAYVAEYNSNLDGGRVSAYAIDQATGTLTLVSHALAVPGYLPTAMAIGHSGAYAYVVNDAPSLPEQSGNVSVLAINGTTGALTPTALSPVQAGNEPLGIAIHPSGAYAYVTNSVSNDVSVYAIDSATGALTPIAGSPFPAGNYPSSIAITP